MTPQSSFIISHYEGFGGSFIDSQYLGAAYNASKPHVFENTLMKIYSSQNRFFTDGKLLMKMLGQQGSYGIQEIETDVYRWTLQGAEKRSAISKENVETSTTPGLANTTFRIKLDIDYYHAPDVLLSEDNELPLQIVEGPIFDGTGYVYIVRIQTDDPTVYINPTYLEQGHRFDKSWTSVASEANDIFGTQQVPASFKLESQVGFFGQKMTVTDKAMREEGRLGIDFIMTDDKGRESKVSRFLPAYESRMKDEFYSNMEAALVYGKRSTFAGPKKYFVKTGPGMREQLKDGWTQYYPGMGLTADFLRDYLFDIFFARENEGSRSVRMMTGSIGSILFHQALANLANGFLTVDTHFIRSTEGVGPTPGLAYGAQFTKYTGPTGIEITLIKNPLYDSEMYCKQSHPLYPGKPIDSARFTVLDFGSSDGKNNVSMLRVKNSYVHGYTLGLVGPSGPTQGGQVSATVNGYDVAMQGSAGLLIRDVTRGGELIPDVN